MWHKSTIEYTAHSGKVVKENFLHQAISYGDVEAQLADCLKGRVTEFDTPNIARVKYAEVIFNSSKLPFYVVKVAFIGIKKETRSQYLIPAESPKDAQIRVDEYLKNSMQDYKIKGADEEKILGVWFPHNDIWQGDFRNRMDDQKENGKHSPDLNQLELDFEANKAAQQMADSLDATVTVKNKKGKKITFHKKNGDPINS